jgi:hypothetical protein
MYMNEHVAGVGETRNAFRNLMGNSHWKRSLGKPENVHFENRGVDWRITPGLTLGR